MECMKQIYCIRTVRRYGTQYDVLDVTKDDRYPCLKIQRQCGVFLDNPEVLVRIDDIRFGHEWISEFCICDTRFPDEDKLLISACIKLLQDGTLQALSLDEWSYVVSETKIHVNQIKFHIMPDNIMKDFPLLNVVWAKIRVEYMIVSGLLRQIVMDDIRWLVLVQYLKLHDANASESWSLFY